MKKLFVILFLLAAVIPAAGQTMNDYKAVPPFLGQTTQPNILMIQDVTGSMYWRAAATVNSGNYDSTASYYGYFDPTKKYMYVNGCFHETTATTADTTLGLGPVFKGDILNWGLCSRIDIARKVLIGGKARSRPAAGTVTGTGTADTTWLTCQGDDASGTNIWPCTYTKTTSTPQRRITFWKTSSDSQCWIVRRYYKTSTSSWVRQDSILYYSRVKVAARTARGVVHQIADKDFNNRWDYQDSIDCPRFGLMLFSTSVGRDVRSYIGNSPLSAFCDSLQGITPGGSTNGGDAVWEATCYFSQRANYWTGDYRATEADSLDPMYVKSSGGTYIAVPCRKNFAMILTDGEFNSDNPISGLDASMPHNTNPYSATNQYNWDNTDNTDDQSNDHCADDYAYYGHINDLRTPTFRDMSDKQNLTWYGIMCFGSGATLLQNIAKKGGFIDLNGDNIWQTGEYDADGDGVPDNYYEAQEGSQLEASVTQAIASMLQKAASASAVSIAASSSSGEGTVYQAYFQPSKALSTGGQLLWSGYIRALWTDRYGNLREDTDGDHNLDMLDDYVIRAKLGTDTIYSYRDQDGLGGAWPGLPLVQVAPVTLAGIKDVWNGGNWLWNASAGSRTIFTMIGSTKTSFVSSNGAGNTITPYIGAPSTRVADTIIDYIRGIDNTNWRPRKADSTSKVWKLGDIIYSSPSYMARPAERYDLLYRDTSYNRYFVADSGRSGTVFIGANDGMLHAFYAGRFVPNTSSSNIKGSLIDATKLGQERWAYVPFNLLPHLKWLKDRLYPHTYYVDLKAKVTDAKIFTADATHPNGWGSILIGGMRLGGGEIVNPTTTSDTLRSAYFCIDVTDSTNPTPLWEFDNDTLGFTTCYPAIATIGTNWYMLIGSGPLTYDGTSNRRPKVWVLNLATGARVASFTVADSNASVGDITTVDLDLNYKTDAAYFGTYTTFNRAQGELWRLCFRATPNLPGTEATTPASWTLDTVCNVRRPIQGAPVVASDQLSRTWVYFGTGRYYCDNDEGDSVHQAFFGVRDSLMKTKISSVAGSLINVSTVAVFPDSVKFGTRKMTFNALVDTVNKFKGWYRDLDVATTNPGPTYQSERVLTRPVVAGGAIVYTSFQPSVNVCAQGGDGYAYGLYYLTGTAYTTPIFQGTNAAAAQGVATGDNAIKLHLGSGMPSAPSISVSRGGEHGSTATNAQVMGADGTPVTIGLHLPFNPVSGAIFWKRQ